ncbi:hypothetical protein CLOM_g19828 [Closterium sp. NIES-68]|nr:hypothetical protein CLOM_g19828 [Closterium sp. NIES-68]
MDMEYLDDDDVMSDYDDDDNDQLADSDEDELDKDEERIQNPSTIRNPDGTYRCPFCPGQKKQDYRFNEVTKHAEDQAKGSSRKGPKERRRHQMLLQRLMREDLQPDKPVRVIKVEPRETPKIVEDRILWPPVAIVKNLQTGLTYDANQKKEILGGVTREQIESTFKSYGPRKVEVLYNYKGHTGTALIHFEENAKGWEAASKLDKTYAQSELGREGYLKGRGREKDEWFAWAARERDLEAEGKKGPIGSALHRKHKGTKSLAEVLEQQDAVKRQQEREEKRVQERAFMRLSEKLQRTEDKLKEMENSAMALRRKHEEELAEAHERTRAMMERRMRNRMREVEQMEREMEALQRQLVARSANEQETKRRLDELTRQLSQQEQQGELQQQQAQRRAREMEELEAKFQRVRLTFEEKHRIEVEMEEAKGKQGGEGGGEASKEAEERMRQLEEELEGAKDMLDMEQERFSRLSVDARVRDDDVSHARATAMEFLVTQVKHLKKIRLPAIADLVNSPPVHVQTVGLLSKRVWLKAYKESNECSDDRNPNWQADFTMKFSDWEDTLKSHDYSFFRVVETEKGAKWVFNDADEQVAEAMGKIRKDFGAAGVADFKRAAAEIEEYNASGRYPVRLLVSAEGNPEGGAGEEENGGEGTNGGAATEGAAGATGGGATGGAAGGAAGGASGDAAAGAKEAGGGEEVSGVKQVAKMASVVGYLVGLLNVFIAAAPKAEPGEGRKKRRVENGAGAGGGGGAGGELGEDSATGGGRGESSAVGGRGVDGGARGGRGEESSAGSRRGTGRGSGRGRGRPRGRGWG